MLAFLTLVGVALFAGSATYVIHLHRDRDTWFRRCQWAEQRSDRAARAIEQLTRERDTAVAMVENLMRKDLERTKWAN